MADATAAETDVAAAVAAAVAVAVVAVTAVAAPVVAPGATTVECPGGLGQYLCKSGARWKVRSGTCARAVPGASLGLVPVECL